MSTNHPEIDAIPGHILQRHGGRIEALRRMHGQLEDEIADEAARPAPDEARLKGAKRRKLRVTETLARFGTARLS